MISKLRVCVAASMATSALLTACGDDSTQVGGNGGLGGSGGAGGSAAGQGGMAGSAGQSGVAGQGGMAGAGGAPATPRFQVTLDGDRLKVIALDPVWYISCEHKIQAIQRDNDSWSVLRDDRYGDFRYQFAPHFLDGELQPQCEVFPCDNSSCTLLPSGPDLVVGGVPIGEVTVPAREFVQVGQRAAPLCGEGDAGVDAGLDAGPDAGGRQVADIETRTPSGTLGVRVRYFLDQGCSGQELTADIALPVQ